MFNQSVTVVVTVT